MLAHFVDASGEWYVVPGGGVQHGETIEEAFHRELQEEIGARAEHPLYGNAFTKTHVQGLVRLAEAGLPTWIPRRLTTEERRALFAALDTCVPDSGCVGPNRSSDEEVYFTVEAPTPEAARLAAGALLERTIAAAGVHVAATITVQADSRACQHRRSRTPRSA